MSIGIDSCVSVYHTVLALLQLLVYVWVILLLLRDDMLVLISLS